MGLRHGDLQHPGLARARSASLRAWPEPAEGAGATVRDRVPRRERSDEEE